MQVKIGPYKDDGESRDFEIHLDNYDTWALDATLGLIAVPLLKQLRDTKQSAPFVDPEDVPITLKPTSTDEYGTDNTHFERWDYVVNEMIFAMEMMNFDWESQFYKYEECEESDDPNDEGWLGVKCVWKDDEGRKKFDERISNGCRLFGKYFRSLWA